MTEKEIYRQLCLSTRIAPVFMNDWWLDAVCGKENWDVVTIEKGGHVAAVFPYYYVHKRVFSHIGMPKLTPFMGPWIKYPENQKLVTRLGYEKEIITALIRKLPRVDVVRQNISPMLGNWLPFHWAGFEVQPRITYELEDLSDLDIVWSGMKENIKTDIRKAEKLLSIVESDDIQGLYGLIKLTYERQAKQPTFAEQQLYKIDVAIKTQGDRTLYFAQDEHGKRHAGIYLIHDADSTYYLIGASDPKLRNSGAGSLLLWEGIKKAASLGTRFDFEGSIIPSIEKIFRAFGARQKQYFSVVRKSLRYQLLDGLRMEYQIVKSLVRRSNAEN